MSDFLITNCLCEAPMQLVSSIIWVGELCGYLILRIIVLDLGRS
jgi:hypothetical protein